MMKCINVCYIYIKKKPRSSICRSCRAGGQGGGGGLLNQVLFVDQEWESYGLLPREVLGH